MLLAGQGDRTSRPTSLIVECRRVRLESFSFRFTGFALLALIAPASAAPLDPNKAFDCVGKIMRMDLRVEGVSFNDQPEPMITIRYWGTGMKINEIRMFLVANTSLQEPYYE